MARRTAGSAALVLVDGAIELHPEPALFEAMIEGWRRQHSARRLSPAITVARERVLRRFQAFSGAWPWEWRSEQLEAWVAQGEWAHSTVRGYQGSVALFLDFVCDPRYGWREACMERVGEVPTQICHEWNSATHVADYEGRPERRPLTRDECQALFDVADDKVADIARTRRKGWLAAFRDATLFKVVYAWGLRRREAAMLDVGDFAANPAVPELGRLGTCHVRYGKAMKGSPPRRRQVATVMPWAAEVLEQYIDELRPRYGPAALGPKLTHQTGNHRRGPASAHEVKDFLGWAAQRKATGRFEIPGPPLREGTALDDEDRWAIVARLLHDDGLCLTDRVAGCLVLLYAQQLSRIVAMTVDQVITADDGVYLRLGPGRILVPEPMGSLVVELVTIGRSHVGLGSPAPHRWLFPGLHAGRPLHPGQLGQRLAKLGVDSRAGRRSALMHLAGQIPAAVLAEMLHLHPTTAVHWVAAAGGDWSTYAAQVARDR